MQGHVLGGSVTGDVDVAQWLSPQPASLSAREKQTNRQSGSARLRFKDLSAAEIAAALATPSRPFRKIKPAGLVSGKVDTGWKDSVRETEAQFVADVLPPASSTKTQFPLTGHGQGTYRFGPGELDLAELSAATRATQVHAWARFRPPQRSNSWSRPRTSANGSRFHAAGYAGEIPVTLKGRASFNGTATGKLSQIAISGNLQSQDFETAIPATSYTPERTINWNALQADIQLSPSVFTVRNGTLSRDPDSLKFDFHAQLAARQFTDNSPFQAHVDTPECGLAGILALAGLSYPVTGIVDLHLDFSGTRSVRKGKAACSCATEIFTANRSSAWLRP